MLHSIDVGFHLLRPLRLDGGLSPHTSVQSWASSEGLNACLKACRDAGKIKTVFDDPQPTLQTSQRYKRIFVDKGCVVV